MPVRLERTLSGHGPAVRLDIAEDFDASEPDVLQLRLRLNEWVKGDVVQTWWDGEKLGPPEMAYCRLDDPSPPGGAFQPLPRWRDLAEVSSAVWLTWDLSAAAVPPGEHAVRVDLHERHPQVASSLTLTDVELVVRYRQNSGDTG